MGFFKPLLNEAGLLDKNNASDPMGSMCSIADAAMVTNFMALGADAVGGMGEGIDFSGVMPAATPAPTLANAPAMNVSAAPAIPTPSLNRM